MAKQSTDRGEKTKAGAGQDDGFTLVELLVVLGIVALIAAIATPRVLRYLDDARVTTTNAQIGNLTSALELFYLDTGRYPSTEEGLPALTQMPTGADRWNGPYLRNDDALTDAWGRPFRYRLDIDGAQPVIVSFGRDGTEGGEGPDADIGG